MPYIVETVFNKIPVAIVGLRQRTAANVDKTTDDIIEDIKASFFLPKTGRVYGEHHISATVNTPLPPWWTGPAGITLAGTHQASAPGEPPAVWLADLLFSIRKGGSTPFDRTVEVGTEHALPLEFGRVDGHFAARPFAGPAVEKARPKFVGYFMEEAWVNGA